MKRTRTPENYEEQSPRKRRRPAPAPAPELERSAEYFTNPFTIPEFDVGPAAFPTSYPSATFPTDFVYTNTAAEASGFASIYQPTSSPATIARPEGFATRAEPSRTVAKKHECSHCGHERTFTTSNDLTRHLKTVHGIIKEGEKIWRCQIAGCPVSQKLWPRLDNFKQHVTRMHGREHTEDAEDMSENYQFTRHGPIQPYRGRRNRVRHNQPQNAPRAARSAQATLPASSTSPQITFVNSQFHTNRPPDPT